MRLEDDIIRQYIIFAPSLKYSTLRDRWIDR